MHHAWRKTEKEMSCYSFQAELLLYHFRKAAALGLLTVRPESWGCLMVSWIFPKADVDMLLIISRWRIASRVT